MIAADQPTIFPSGVVVGLSSVGDGTMKRGTAPEDMVLANRKSFLDRLGLPEKVAIPELVYEGNNYCRYSTVNAPAAVVADALATATAGVPIFLPLADCTGAVMYDPVHHVCMVSHLGRHSTEQDGAKKSILYMKEQFGSAPVDILVWLSPSPNSTDYPLWKFNNRSFTDVLTEQLLAAGVLPHHLEASQADTATNPEYFSHSQFLKGQQAIDGRYAIAAMIV